MPIRRCAFTVALTLLEPAITIYPSSFRNRDGNLSELLLEVLTDVLAPSLCSVGRWSDDQLADGDMLRLTEHERNGAGDVPRRERDGGRS